MGRLRVFGRVMMVAVCAAGTLVDRAGAVDAAPPAAAATPSPVKSASLPPLLPPEGLPTAPPPDQIEPVEPRAGRLGLGPRPVAARPVTGEPGAFRYLAVITGECQRLVLAGRDRTATCGDALVNVDFGDGRVAFVFSSPREHLVTTFLGRSSAQQTLRDYRLEIDAVSTARRDARGAPTVVAEPAAGHCAMTGDPTRERARFECTAERASGKTSATFLSLGTPTIYAGDGSAPDASVAVSPTF